ENDGRRVGAIAQDEDAIVTPLGTSTRTEQSLDRVRDSYVVAPQHPPAVCFVFREGHRVGVVDDSGHLSLDRALGVEGHVRQSAAERTIGLADVNTMFEVLGI